MRECPTLSYLFFFPLSLSAYLYADEFYLVTRLPMFRWNYDQPLIFQFFLVTEASISFLNILYMLLIMCINEIYVYIERDMCT